MKRSKKPLTFTAIAAGLGALSLAVEGCVYGPPPTEVNVYGPPSDYVRETKDTEPFKPSAGTDESWEEVVYGPPSESSLDGIETDVYGPPEDFT